GIESAHGRISIPKRPVVYFGLTVSGLTSHNLMTPSNPDEASVFASGEKATDRQPDSPSLSVAICLRRTTSQTRTTPAVPSLSLPASKKVISPEANRPPRSEKLTQKTSENVGSLSVATASPESAFHVLTLPSLLDVASVRPLG